MIVFEVFHPRKRAIPFRLVAPGPDRSANTRITAVKGFRPCEYFLHNALINTSVSNNKISSAMRLKAET